MVTDNHYRWDFIGLSTDQKPTPATSSKVSDGSTFYCSDNSKLYVWYKDQWYERTSSGGGASYTAGTGIDITDGTISVDTEDIQEKLTAGSNITISDDNVISASGGGGNVGEARILTAADYNWNSTAGDATTTPFDCIALWLLPMGHYAVTNYSLTIRDTVSTTVSPYDYNAYIITKTDNGYGTNDIVQITKFTGNTVTSNDGSFKAIGFSFTDKNGYNFQKTGKFLNSKEIVQYPISSTDNKVGKVLSAAAGYTLQQSINDIGVWRANIDTYFKVLSEDDVNYRDGNDNDIIALWMMQDGIYIVPRGLSVDVYVALEDEYSSPISPISTNVSHVYFIEGNIQSSGGSSQYAIISEWQVSNPNFDISYVDDSGILHTV